MNKTTHFLPVKTPDSADDYDKLYLHELLRIDRIPLSIILDRGTSLPLNFVNLFRRVMVCKKSFVLLVIPR